MRFSLERTWLMEMVLTRTLPVKEIESHKGRGRNRTSTEGHLLWEAARQRPSS